MAQTLATSSDIISLPSGGGQIAGLGETFQPNLFTGTGNFSIPISCPPGINNLKPDLALGYTTGGGNGPFGMGFRLGVLSISRSTRKGLPNYRIPRNTPVAEQFQLAGAQDLVECGDNRYRPRFDQTFWLIEQKEDHWEIATKDNSMHFLGTTPNSRVSNTDLPRARVFSWLLDRMVDPNGNEIKYSYLEDGSQRYLSSVSYGPFEIVIEYIDTRPDPFISRRAGFVIETRLRAQRIRILSHRNGTRELRRYELEYDEPSPRKLSLLKRITMAAGGSTTYLAMPTLTFDYSQLEFEKQPIITFTSETGLVPPDLANPNISLLDLTGDGLPDAIISDEFSLSYWRNLGNGLWAEPTPLAELSTEVQLGDSLLRFADLEGNGTADLLIGSNIAGYYPNAAGADWETPILYESSLPFDLTDPNLRLVDIDGDGRVDAIYSSSTSFLIYFNRGREGWEQTATVIPRIYDLSLWPDVSFSDERVRFADMTGDGLMDIVMIESGEISYWPNLGYGRWGQRVQMDASPVFPSGLKYELLYLIDIDSDGAADFVYVDQERDCICIWLNHEGRYFSDLKQINELPRLRGAKTLIVDMLGHGKPGLLISYPDGNSQYQYIELSGVNKAPFLMTQIDNGMGGVTKIKYEPVEQFRRFVRMNNRDWKSFLPFPMHVVSSIEVEDRWTKNKSITKFKYSDGHYDGESREFRGFAEVEELEQGDQWSPTIRRVHNFHVGADITKSEAQRRDSPKEAQERLRALSGKELRVSIYQGPEAGESNEERDRIENSWAVSVVENTENGNIYFPSLRESIAIEFSENDQNKINITRNLRYDREGNLLEREIVGGRQGSSFQEELYLKETFSYANSLERLGGWRAQALCMSKVSDARNNLLAVTRTYFDGDFFVGLPLGEMDRGNISRIEDLAYDEAIADMFPNVDLEMSGYHRANIDGITKWFRNRIRYRWAADGRIEEIMGPRDEVLKVEYDSYGIHPLRSTNSLNHITELSIDETVEAVREVRYPSGYIEARKYDPLGRVVQQIRLGDDDNQYVYRAIHYNIGRLCGHDSCPPSITTLVPREQLTTEDALPDLDSTLSNKPDFIVQRVFYNGFGRELQRRLSAEPDEQGVRQVSVSARRWYDKRGFLYAQGDPFFCNSFDYGEPPSQDDDNTISFEFHRDYRGRVTRAYRTNIGYRLTHYSPWKITAWDEEDSVLKKKPTKEEYFDSWNRQIEVREYEDIDTYRKTTYRYDHTNNLKAVIDNFDRLILELDHDYLGRRISIAHYDSGNRSYFYNSGSKIAETNNSLGINFVNNYDILNRVIQIGSRLDNGAVRIYRRFYYDSNPDDETQPNLTGRLAKIDDELGNIRFEYDLKGLNTLKSRELADGSLYEIRSEYDTLLNVTAIIYPNGTRVQYTYNESNLVQSIPGVVNKISYGINGQPTEITFVNGVKESYTYDEVYRLEKFSVKDSTSGRNFLSQNYIYNEGLNVARLEEDFEIESSTFAFEYDGYKQLTRVFGTNGEYIFEYDATGNIVRNSQVSSELYGYNDSSHPNRLTDQPSATGSTQNTYDDLGRLASSAKFNRMEYDAFDRLRYAECSDGANVELAFGHGRGRVLKRVQSSSGSIKETFYFDEIYEQTEGFSKVHVLMSGTFIASILQDDHGNESLEVHHKDRLGSTRCITDEHGNIKLTQDYTTYGQAFISSTPVRYYIGREFDEDLELTFLGTRFYDPSIGRFITPDEEIFSGPVRFLSSPTHYNPYTYSTNNPINRRDPNGRFAIVAAIAVGAAIGGTLGYFSAKEQGYNPWSGALLGAVIGAATVGYAAYAGGAALAWGAVKAGVFGALTGAGISATSSYFSGGDYENVWTSAAIGFAFGAAGFVVGDWQPVVAGEGLWVNVQNIGLEIAYDAGKGALIGSAYSAATGGNIRDGFVDGAVKGAMFSAVKIAVLGVMYRPLEGQYYEVEHQYGWDSHNVDRSHLAPQMQAHEGLPSLEGARFRRYGLINLINGGRSIVLGNNISMAEGDHYTVTTLAHEIRHIHQQQLMTLGSVEFYVRYLLMYALSSNWQYSYKDHPNNDTYETPHN